MKNSYLKLVKAGKTNNCFTLGKPYKVHSADEKMPLPYIVCDKGNCYAWPVKIAYNMLDKLATATPEDIIDWYGEWVRGESDET